MTKISRSLFFIIAALFISLLTSPFAFAQDSADDIENLFQKEEQQAPVAEPAPAPTTEAARSQELKEVSDLGKLSTFDDVAVIQKRFLPKTGRFEFNVGLSSVMNDAFFLNFGLNARLGYYFRERYGIELVGYGLSMAERQVTTDLREKKNVTTQSYVATKSYFGLDFKWVPIYGKMTWLNNAITPFDLYFSAGGGMTSTNQGTTEPTIHLGTGQVFAITQGTAFRWDFSYNGFQSASGLNTNSAKSYYQNLIVTLGMSFFFPEATYR